MESKFTTNFLKKETMSANYQTQARACRQQNNNAASEQECRFLQMAADLEFEMAQISIGAEQARHTREKNRLDYEIMKIRQELNPGSVKKAAADKEGGKAPAPGAEGEKTKEEEALDRTVRTWYKEAPRHSFEDVSGMIELKKRLQGCVSDAKSEELMDYLQIPHLNSYFFVGPPGCGKTYIIEAFAHELLEQDYKYLSLQGSDIISRYVGDAEKIVTRLFEEAEKSAPCIVFIDEIDSVCKNRSLPNLPEYAANITTSFLTGFNRIHSSDSKVIFIGATNYPQRVDSAMLDRVEVIEVPLPDTEAREAAIRKRFEDILIVEKGLSFGEMAAVTEGYNYRDFERLTTRIKREAFKEVLEQYDNQFAAIGALRNGSYMLTRKKWEEALSKFRPSPKKDILDAIADWKRRNLDEDDDMFYAEDDEHTEPRQIQD